MSRRNRSAEEQARRAKIRELLQESNISSMEDIQNLFKETIAEFMENGLDVELDEVLGYSRYDYKSKNTDISQNSRDSSLLKTRISIRVTYRNARYIIYYLRRIVLNQLIQLLNGIFKRILVCLLELSP